MLETFSHQKLYLHKEIPFNFIDTDTTLKLVSDVANILKIE